jgi:hypothetical protein
MSTIDFFEDNLSYKITQLWRQREMREDGGDREKKKKQKKKRRSDAPSE